MQWTIRCPGRAAAEVQGRVASAVIGDGGVVDPFRPLIPAAVT